MNCFLHPVVATAVCIHCGRALCPDCVRPTPDNRISCSAACATSLCRQSEALQGIVTRHAQSARINAVFYLLCGLLSLAGAVAAHFYLPAPFLIWFCAGSGAIFLLSGAWQWFSTPTSKPK